MLGREEVGETEEKDFLDLVQTNIFSHGERYNRNASMLDKEDIKTERAGVLI